LALLATAAASFAAAFAVGLFGIGIAPSWFLWYVVIVLLRRSPIILNLADADSVVVDPATSRVAFHVPFEGSERWFAVEPASRGSAAVDAVRVAFPTKFSEGSIAGPNLVPIVLMLVFSAACFAFVIWCAVR
jgi:hypothetical protein